MMAQGTNDIVENSLPASTSANIHCVKSDNSGSSSFNIPSTKDEQEGRTKGILKSQSSLGNDSIQSKTRILRPQNSFRTLRPQLSFRTKKARYGPLNASRVSFGRVSITFFPTIIGDNPSVSHGCPVALSSKACTDRKTIGMSVFNFDCHRAKEDLARRQEREEINREQTGKAASLSSSTPTGSSTKTLSKKTKKKQLNHQELDYSVRRNAHSEHGVSILSGDDRSRRLLRAGYSRVEIQQAIDEAKKARGQRLKSNRKLHLDDFNFWMEKTSRSFSKIRLLAGKPTKGSRILSRRKRTSTGKGDEQNYEFDDSFSCLSIEDGLESYPPSPRKTIVGKRFSSISHTDDTETDNSSCWSASSRYSKRLSLPQDLLTECMKAA